jgi:hypothetical protein
MQSVCVHISGPSNSTISFHIFSKRYDFRKNVLNIKLCYWFSLKRFLKYLSFYEKQSEICSKMCASLRVKYPLLVRYFNENWIFSTYFQKLLKFHDIPSSESPVVPCGRTYGQTERQADMNKLMVAFRKFANAPKKMTFFRQTDNNYVNIRKCIHFLIMSWRRKIKWWSKDSTCFLETTSFWYVFRPFKWLTT